VEVNRDDKTPQATPQGPGPRERILKAALELFVEQGYFNTNVPDISKRSRCSVGSIYHHFLNKEEIAQQLYQDGIKQFREAISPSIDVDLPLEKNIQNLIQTFLSFAETHRLLSRYLWLARHTEFLSKKVALPTCVGHDELGRKLTQAIKNAMRKGEVPKHRAQILWTMIFGMPISYIRDWLDGYVADEPSIVAPTISKACYAAIKGSA
jgi:AcrR family transcriptional regulator